MHTGAHAYVYSPACILVSTLCNMQVVASCFYLLLRTLRPELLPAREDIVQQDIANEIAALQVSTTTNLSVHVHIDYEYAPWQISATILSTLTVLYALTACTCVVMCSSCAAPVLPKHCSALRMLNSDRRQLILFVSTDTCVTLWDVTRKQQAAELMPVAPVARKGSRKRHSDSSSSSSGSESDSVRVDRSGSSNGQKADSTLQQAGADMRK
jgi:hypothetical protein